MPDIRSDFTSDSFCVLLAAPFARKTTPVSPCLSVKGSIRSCGVEAADFPLPRFRPPQSPPNSSRATRRVVG